MSKKTAAIVSIAVIAALLIMTVPALADGFVTIQAGVWAVTPQDVDFGSWPFDFAERLTGYVGSASPWVVSNALDEATAWEVYIAATDFTDGVDSIPVTLAGQTVLVNNPTAGIVCIAGDCSGGTFDPISTAFGGASSYLDNATPLRILRSHATDIELGEWEFSPVFNLRIPGGLLPSTYTSTWTVTIVAAP